MANPHRNWERDELLVAFNLYCRTPFGRLHRLNPDIIALAKVIGRTPSSLAMKLCNFASLDPVQRDRGIRGLRGAARADGEIFAEFCSDWVRLAAESEEAMERLGVRSEVSESEALDELLTRGGPTEVTRMVKTRRVQGLFRATVLASYDFSCAISGINIPDLVIASHIVPWAKEESKRLDPRNGIALSALYDRAFDRGLIGLDDSLKVIVSGKIRVKNPTEMHRETLLGIAGRPLRLPSRFKPDLDAIGWHRKNIFVA